MQPTRLSLSEIVHSARNQVFLNARALLRYRRPGYQETGAGSLVLEADEAALEERFGLRRYRHLLSAVNYRRNLWTLWVLDRMLGSIEAPPAGAEALEVLEPGCQDFSRLPALRSFFRARGWAARFTGIELDPYPVLHDLHSRWDRAHYYIGLESGRDRYVGADFFRWQAPADLVLAFYPFVSTYPALAWGLPARFGDATPWLKAFERCLKPGGIALVVHQGDWEQEEFDLRRSEFSLELLARDSLECPFYPTPHPACVSVYGRP